MSTNETMRARIRVVKRQQRDLQTPPDSSPAPSQSRTNRALASTVSSWVEESRLRRQSETAAFFNLARLRTLVRAYNHRGTEARFVELSLFKPCLCVSVVKLKVGPATRERGATERSFGQDSERKDACPKLHSGRWSERI